MTIKEAYWCYFTLSLKLSLNYQQTYPILIHRTMKGLSMKKRSLLLLLLCSTPALADNTTVFQCKTTNNKIVYVKLDHEKLYYRFRKLKATPELSFSIPKNKASTFQWKGWGNAISYTVNIPHGNITYTVYSSVNKLTEEQEVEAGIMVQNKDNLIARILCHVDDPFYINNMEGVDLPPEE